MLRTNAMLRGHGASGAQDRGAHQSITLYGSNPAGSSNQQYRWQEYTRLYLTAWEARKIVDIPVEDALRKPFELRGLGEADATRLMRAYEDFDCDRQLRRALIQERLYGGCLIFPVLRQEPGVRLAAPLDMEDARPGDLLAFNVVDVSQIGRVETENDPFSPAYDRAAAYLVSGVEVHASRLIVLDGSPLLNRVSRSLAGAAGLNAAGFGESKLAPIYDLLVRVIGTQQGAYHLVNMASVLLVEVERLAGLNASASPALDYLQKMTEQISLYRAGILDQRARVSQHSASFGGVPELMMNFAQFLAAASDIAATRFLGQSPGGLNATGESDMENYYNMVDAYVSRTVAPTRRRLLDFAGVSLWGAAGWARKSAKLELLHQSLWNLSDKERSEVDKTYAEMLLSLKEIIGPENLAAELKARGLFKTDPDLSGLSEQEKEEERAAEEKA